MGMNTYYDCGSQPSFNCDLKTYDTIMFEAHFFKERNTFFSFMKTHYILQWQYYIGIGVNGVTGSTE
jgi:hypothetical protein